MSQYDDQVMHDSPEPTGQQDQARRRTLREYMPRPHPHRKPGQMLLLPTSTDYLDENPTVLACLRKPPCNQLCERSNFCQGLGRVGFRAFEKQRDLVIGCCSLFTFGLLIMMILPLIALSDDPKVMRAFRWAEGTVQWDLVVPQRWTDQFALGLSGMTNSSDLGNLVWYPYTSPACQDVLGDACAQCAGAAGAATGLLIMAIVFTAVGYCCDFLRVFQFFDTNCYKGTAICLQGCLSTLFLLLPLVIFSIGCVGSLPADAVYPMYDVGMTFEWKLSLGSSLLIAVLVLRPIPALFHLCIPTPFWASGQVDSYPWQGPGETMMDSVARTRQPGTAGREGSEFDTPYEPGQSEMGYRGEDPPAFDSARKPDKGQKDVYESPRAYDSAYSSHAPYATSSSVRAPEPAATWTRNAVDISKGEVEIV